DVLLVILHHLLHERLVEFAARESREAAIFGLLLETRLRRGSHSHRGSGRHGLAVGSGVILLENRAEVAYPFACALLLRELAHLDLGQVSFDRLLDEGIRLGAAAERERSEERRV